MLYSASSMIATGILLPLLLGAVSTGVRFLIRLRIQPAAVGADDWTILCATIVVLALGALQSFDAVRGTLGRSDSDQARARVGWKVNYANSIVEKLAFGFVKISILFFYRRIFSRWSDFRRLNTALIVVVTVWAFVYLVGEPFICGLHPEITWNQRDVADQKCMDHGIYSVSFAASDVLTDIVVIGVPILFIPRLQISKRQRSGVIAVFLLGFLSTLAGIFRLVALCLWEKYGQFKWKPPKLDNPPKILMIINPLFFSQLELCIGVLTANLMTFAPLIRQKSSLKQMLCGGRRKPSISASSSEEGTKSKLDRTTKIVNVASEDLI